MNIRFTVRRNDFAKIAAQLPARAELVLDATALEIEGGAKQRSRVRTGTMRRGWHIVRGTFRRTIGNPVPYAIYNERGTSRMAAQPMVTPAVVNARGSFAQRLASLFR